MRFGIRTLKLPEVSTDLASEEKRPPPVIRWNMQPKNAGKELGAGSGHTPVRLRNRPSDSIKRNRQSLPEGRTLSSTLATALSAVLLVAVLACAVIRPFGLPEATVAVPAAGVVIAAGAITLDHARAEAELLGPVVGFLAAVLVLAKLCDDEGLFQAVRRLAGPYVQGAAATAAGRRLRARLGHHGRAEPGRHRRAAHSGGVRDRGPARRPPEAPRLRLPPICRTRPRCCCPSPTSPTCWRSRPAV